MLVFWKRHTETKAVDKQKQIFWANGNSMVTRRWSERKHPRFKRWFSMRNPPKMMDIPGIWLVKQWNLVPRSPWPNVESTTNPSSITNIPEYIECFSGGLKHFHFTPTCGYSPIRLLKGYCIKKGWSWNHPLDLKKLKHLYHRNFKNTSECWHPKSVGSTKTRCGIEQSVIYHTSNDLNVVQGGPLLPVIHGVITPISRVK